MHDTDIWLILKRLDAFEEKLEKLEKEIRILQKQTSVPAVWSNDPTRIPPPYWGGKSVCIFDSLPPEDKMKPMSISCPCPKCSPYSLSQGSLSDAGLSQVWKGLENFDLGKEE